MKTIIQVEQEPQLNVSVEESTENILVSVFQSPDINIEVSGIVYGDSNVDLTNYWTKTESDSKYKSIGYVPTWNSITGKPTFFSGNYNDLTNKPTLFNGTWASLSGTPTTIAGYGITDAFDGNYDSLSNKPTSFPPSTHTHEISDINNLEGSLENKLDKPTTDGTYLVKKTGGIISYETFSSVDLSNYYTKTETYSQTEINDFLSGKQNTIGYTPEDVANKSDSYTASSSTTYASTKALVDGLATKLDKGTYTGTAQELYDRFEGKIEAGINGIPKVGYGASGKVLVDSVFTEINGKIGIGLSGEASEKLEVNGNIKATQIKDPYGTLKAQRCIIITGNTMLSETHNGAALNVTNTCNITIPTGLDSNFQCVVFAKGSIIVTFVNSGVTIYAPSGLLLKQDKMASLICTGTNSFNLTGELATS